MTTRLEFIQTGEDERGVPYGRVCDDAGETLLPYGGYMTLLEAEYMASIMAVPLYEM